MKTIRSGGKLGIDGFLQVLGLCNHDKIREIIVASIERGERCRSSCRTWEKKL
jgi:hypothetical protein